GPARSPPGWVMGSLPAGRGDPDPPGRRDVRGLRRPVSSFWRADMARPEKVAVVEEIREKVADADATVLTEYRGLKVHELAELRAALRPTGTEYKVFKNTLARRAMDGAELADVASLLEGPVAIAFVRGDAAAAAKALREFGRTNPALVLKGGL